MVNIKKIGIVGAGHLGLAVAKAFLNNGYDIKNIYISYGGSKSTLEKIKNAGLEANIFENEEIFKIADVIFITVKPQDIFKLGNIENFKKPLILSCAAGVTFEKLKSIFKENVYRIMLSGPDTVLSLKGLGACFPQNNEIFKLLSSVNIKMIETKSEEDINIFTVGVCLPAAILFLDDIKECERQIKILEKKFVLISELFLWAKNTVPSFSRKEEAKEYIDKMITKGGITETVIKSLERGETLAKAFENGYQRCLELSLK